MTIDLNFYPEKETEAHLVLLELLRDDDFPADVTVHAAIRLIVDAEHLLWRALYITDEDGNICPRWPR